MARPTAVTTAAPREREAFASSSQENMTKALRIVTARGGDRRGARGPPRSIVVVRDLRAVLRVLRTRSTAERQQVIPNRLHLREPVAAELRERRRRRVRPE